MTKRLVSIDMITKQPQRGYCALLTSSQWSNSYRMRDIYGSISLIIDSSSSTERKSSKTVISVKNCSFSSAEKDPLNWILFAFGWRTFLPVVSVGDEKVSFGWFEECLFDKLHLNLLKGWTNLKTRVNIVSKQTWPKPVRYQSQLLDSLWAQSGFFKKN